MRKLTLLFLLVFLVSCSPRMHIFGGIMRKHNTSFNKYSSKNPYIKNR